jgi:ribosome-associated protein
VRFGESAENLVSLITSSLEDDKADDIVVIDLHGKTSIADSMVIASGRSTRQVGAMAEHLAQRLKGAGASRVSVEGMPQCDWVLIDGGDVIVHLFRPEIRSFYNLEKMWGEHLPDAGERPAAFA